MTQEDQVCAVFYRNYDEFKPLLRPVSCAADLAELLGLLGGFGADIGPCIRKAFQLVGLEDKAGSVDGRVQGLMDAVCRWALEALVQGNAASFPGEIAVWSPGRGAREVSYTACQCRGLLANVLLLNVRDTAVEAKERRARGGLALGSMLQTCSPIAAEKLACLLAYFETWINMEHQDNSRRVVFQRRCASDTFKEWALSCQTRVCDEPASIHLHSAAMEAIETADAFVNFANPNFGYGRFIASCTQEEIIQVCCPELNVGMLHQGQMTDSEVVNASGVRRFSSYTGYGETFRFAGPWTGMPSVQDILSMDATYLQHFSEAMVLRDVQKAVLCFQGCRAVSTGRWGCGVFRGTPVHKFAQQIVAASLAQCNIHFSTFGTPDCCDKLLGMIQLYKPTTAQLLQALLSHRITSLGLATEPFGMSDGSGRKFVAVLTDILKPQESMEALPCQGRRHDPAMLEGDEENDAV